jgi:DNA invertase Pin-like site-specific DNA recombinase
MLGLAAQIEREFIAARTQEALARRKAQGLPLGRPKGPAARVKLDSDQDLIVAYLHKGVSKRSIARILECSPSTLYAWLRRHRMALRKAERPFLSVYYGNPRMRTHWPCYFSLALCTRKQGVI